MGFVIFVSLTESSSYVYKALPLVNLAKIVVDNI